MVLRFNLYGFEIKFFARLNFYSRTGAIWAEQFAGIGVISMVTFNANNLYGNTPEMQRGALRDRTIADHIPIKLNGIVNGGRPLPHDDKQIGDAMKNQISGPAR